MQIRRYECKDGTVYQVGKPLPECDNPDGSNPCIVAWLNKDPQVSQDEDGDMCVDPTICGYLSVYALPPDEKPADVLAGWYDAEGKPTVGVRITVPVSDDEDDGKTEYVDSCRNILGMIVELRGAATKKPAPAKPAPAAASAAANNGKTAAH